jgi:hypothetical protein
MRTSRDEARKTLIAVGAAALIVGAGMLNACARPAETASGAAAASAADKSVASAAEAAAFTIERVEIATADGKVAVEYPVFAGGADAAVRATVNERIGPRAYFDTDVAGLKAAFASGERPFDQATAAVTFHGKDIAQVVWTVTATGAYTSTSQKTVTVDLSTGALLGAEYLFNDDLAVARYIQERMAPKIAAAAEAATAAQPADAASADAASAENIRELIATREYTPDLIFEAEWSLDGMTFVLPFDFPHALRALEPDPIRETVSWTELARFSYPGSLIERFLTEGSK